MALSSNLARHPFRNERLPWFLAGLLIVSAASISVAHGRFINRLLSGDEANTVGLVREDEARIAALEEGIAREPPLKIEASELSRLRSFKELVDRRVFPWRRLLTELETTLADDVRLTSIAPGVRRDAKGMFIHLQGLARTKDAAFSLAEALDASPAFSRVVLKSLAEDGGETRFDIEAEFDSNPAAAPALVPRLPSPLPGGTS